MTRNPFDLTGKTVLVVGAGSGIGRATAELASVLGANVLLAGRTPESLGDTRRRLTAPDRADIVPLDFLDEAAVGAALAKIDRIDHVVVPAVADENKKRGRFVELPSETMQASFDKFWGQVNVVRAVTPKMIPGGSVALFSSIAALKPGAGSGSIMMATIGTRGDVLTGDG